MTVFLFIAADFVMVVMAVGLLRVLYGPAAADRMMAAQLIGTGGMAALLLLSVATRTSPIVDVALMLALLAAFASIAFVRAASGSVTDVSEASDRG